MNRRSFLSGIIQAGVAASILPSALTYSRRWVKPNCIIVPFWYQTLENVSALAPEYLEMFERLLLHNTEFKEMVELNSKLFQL